MLDMLLRILLLLCVCCPCSAWQPARWLRTRWQLHKYSRQKYWHQIDTTYEGTRLINAEPYIFCVDNFLSNQECAALRAKYDAAAEFARQQGMDSDEDDPDRRTSFGVVATDEEVPEFRKRVATLTRVSTSAIQPIKITRYEEGQAFMWHTDAMPAKFDEELRPLPDEDAAGFCLDGNRALYGIGGNETLPGLNRFCTVLVYLSDCAAGGETCWLWTRNVRRGYYRKPGVVLENEINWRTPQRYDLLVQPKAGMAVVHFPSTTLETGGFSDPNAIHEGAPAIDTKYVAQAFIWNAPPPNAAGDFSFLDDENLPHGRLSESTL